MATSLSVTLVTDESGQIDQAATTLAFTKLLAIKAAELETEQESIAAAVNELFDEYHGASINMPAVASMTSQKLNVLPENFKVISERVLNYVRANSQGKTLEDGTVERPDSLFVIGKGKNGGCKRRADIKPEAPASK